jgi:hypothetical protein
MPTAEAKPAASMAPCCSARLTCLQDDRHVWRFDALVFVFFQFCVQSLFFIDQ